LPRSFTSVGRTLEYAALSGAMSDRHSGWSSPTLMSDRNGCRKISRDLRSRPCSRRGRADGKERTRSQTGGTKSVLGPVGPCCNSPELGSRRPVPFGTRRRRRRSTPTRRIASGSRHRACRSLYCRGQRVNADCRTASASSWSLGERLAGLRADAIADLVGRGKAPIAFPVSPIWLSRRPQAAC
jgi:hypothetical protein